MSSPGKEGLSTGPLTVIGTTVWDSSRFPNVSTGAIDAYGRETRRERGKRGRKIFCIITTFRKEHALKGNILVCHLTPELLTTHRISGKFVFFFPSLSHSFPCLHTFKKFVSKRPAFLIALNYPAMVFLYVLYRLDHRCL